MDVTDLGLPADWGDLFAEDREAVAVDESEPSRYVVTRVQGQVRCPVTWDNAKEFAKSLPLLKPGERINAIVGGNFIFGDFVCAWLLENGVRAEELTICTLGLSVSNVEALRFCVDKGYIGRLNIIVSGFFFVHERHAIIAELLKRMDIEREGYSFSLAAAGIHTKVVLLRVRNGMKFIMRGSANFRSSASLEEFEFENSSELYDFYYTTHFNIMNKNGVIDENITLKKGGEWIAGSESSEP